MSSFALHTCLRIEILQAARLDWHGLHRHRVHRAAFVRNIKHIPKRLAVCIKAQSDH